MIRGTAKPIITSPGMSSSEYEAAVAAFIRTKGVTRCPTVCVIRTQASVPAADRAELRRYEMARELARRENIAVTSRLLGFRIPAVARGSASIISAGAARKSAKSDTVFAS
jgi:hypothetical protein